MPPDSDGAVGAGYFVEFLNGIYTVYSETGAVVQRLSQDDFWLAAGQITPGYKADPRIVYDPSSKRWFAAILGSPNGSAPPDSFLLAVSNGSDPTQGWHAVTVQVGPNASQKYPDFTALGVNEQGVYLEASNDWYIVAVPKADLLQDAPSAVNATVFSGNQDPVDPALPGFVAQPAFAPFLAGPEPFLSAANWPEGELRISSVDWSGTTPTLDVIGSVHVAPMDIPRDAPQLGSDVPIDTVDVRLTDSVVYQDGKLFAVQTVLGSEGRDVLRWYEIADPLTAPTLVATGDISPPGLDAYFGSIAVNPLGEVVIGFSASSPNQYVGSYAVAGSLTAEGIQFGDPIQLAAGESSYVSGRWGDYSATTFDPDNPTHFWTIQELPIGTDAWQTQITELSLSATSPAGKIWIGGGDNRARNPDNWDPAGAPRPGDTLLMPNSGTMNIEGNDLTGDTLQIGGRSPTGPTVNVTLNLSRNAQLSAIIPPSNRQGLTTINVAGKDTLDLSAPSTPGLLQNGGTTVNLSDHARLTAAFDLGAFEPLTVNGGTGAKLVNDQESRFQGTKAAINADVLGIGSFSVAGIVVPGGVAPGELEFGAAVAAGESVTVTGAAAPRPAPGILRIDDPRAFHGSVALQGYGEIDLAGLAKVDSYSYADDTLSLYRHDHVVDTLRLTSSDFQVWKSGSDVHVALGVLPPSGSTLLPPHAIC